MQNTNMSAQEFADKASAFGRKLTVGLTIPMFLFFVGLFTMPLGIIAWIIAVILFMSLFAPNNANNQSKGDTEDRA